MDLALVCHPTEVGNHPVAIVAAVFIAHLYSQYRSIHKYL
jgi:hypothetical protein